MLSDEKVIQKPFSNTLGIRHIVELSKTVALMEDERICFLKGIKFYKFTNTTCVVTYTLRTRKQ